MPDMNHIDADGHVRMVDVSAKDETERRAVARAVVRMGENTVQRMFADDLPKGDALATVRIAAIQGTKRTAELIPLCHPLPIDSVDVSIEPQERSAVITVSVTVRARTGVEMEAMTGASIGALTMYDMVKGIDRSAHIAEVALLEKSGGRSGHWSRS